MISPAQTAAARMIDLARRITRLEREQAVETRRARNAWLTGQLAVLKAERTVLQRTLAAAVTE